MDLKLVKIASVREHMDAHYRGEISYSKAVDLINQDANKQLHIGDVSGSLHRQILEVIMENGFLIKQENWDEKQMEIRATYDAFRIINLVGSHLSNDR